MQGSAQIQVITALLPILMTPIPPNVKFPLWYEVLPAGQKKCDKLVQDRIGENV